MFRCVLVVLIISFGLVSASNKISVKQNASHYFEGTAAKLICLFPETMKGSFMWNSADSALRTGLKCRPDLVCNSVPGYQISRNGQNLTLIIDSVNRSASGWHCSTSTGDYVETINLDILKNPPLHIEITKTDSDFKIKTSCSAVPMNVSCRVNNKEEVGLKDVASSHCSKDELFYMHGTLEKTSASGDITCTITRFAESYSNTYEMSLTCTNNTMYYIGGVLVVIGLIIVIVTIIKRFEHICAAGVSVVLIGIGFLVYNHVFGVFVAFLVLGGLVAVLTIAHLIYVRKDRNKI